MTDRPDYAYGGIRVSVELHEKYLREFLPIWRSAKAANLPLPETDDEDYASLETLLVHVLACARGYMTWMCEALDLPDPGIATAPTPEAVEAEAEAYLSHVLDRWRAPLADVPGEKTLVESKTSWGSTYCIYAMLEHAVLHPLRHAYQLENLME